MTPIVVAFDMDDTFCQTGGYINYELRRIGIATKNAGLLEYLDQHADQVPTMCYPADIKKIVNEKIIGPGIYMLDAKHTELLANDRIGLLRDLKRIYGDLLRIVVCSHRGFHEFGEIFTRKWLTKMSVLDLFDDIHMLDGKHHPDKIKFLKEAYPGSPIKLIDDNPLHDFNKEHDHQEEIMIYDEVHTFPGYKNQARFDGIASIVSWVNDVAQTQEV